MAKKSTKIALTYFITIITSLAVVGGVAYFMLGPYITGDNTKSSGMSGITPAISDENKMQSTDADYIPTAEDNQTIMFIYEAEKLQTSVSFVIARFVPAEEKLVIVPLQTDIRAEIDGKANTLYEFYRLGGSGDLKTAVENALDIKIDKYLKFTRSSFTEFSNMMGNIKFNVPYNLIYEGGSEDIVIKQGEQILDSGALRKVICFPKYDGGEEYRARVVGTIACSLINAGADGIFQESYENVFTDVINSDIETDITKYDFDDKKNAIEYVLKNNTSPAELVVPSGEYDEDNCYVLDEAFIEAISSWLYLY